jgi:hypothetical protein
MRAYRGLLLLAFVPFAHATDFTPLQCGIVGGGEAYPIPVDVAADHATVRTYAELVDALAARDRVVHIPRGVTIEVPNTANALVIPDGTTLYGERGSPVPHLRVAPNGTGENNHAIIAAGNHVTVFGLRIEGPSRVIETNQLTIGIQQQPGTHGLRVQNSELWGWPGAAISIKNAHGAVITANHIHHNRRAQRGYGVVMQNGEATASITCNVFSHNRHAIAGSGVAGEAYQAMANLVLPDGNGHAFDMHRAGTGPGGKAVTIIGNWVAFGGTPWGHYPSVNIRGVPRTGPATIEGNWFQSPLQYIDAGKRTKRAVEGLTGAIPEDSALARDNRFGVAFSIRKDVGACFLRWPGGETRVNCAAVEGVSLPTAMKP